MKQAIIFFTIFCGIIINSAAQQVQLQGNVSVQNSKTNTGQTQYVKNAEVEHINPKNAKSKDVTGDDGKFTLNIQGVQINTQTRIAVNLSGAYSDYVLVNEKELQDITLGRITPVKVYVCKKGDLENRRAEMVNINMKKYRDQIASLQKELNVLRDNYDYDNTRYAVLEREIESLSRAERDMHSLIRGWAESLTIINLDDADESYVKAYNCFANGHLDSVSYYLPDVVLKQQKEQLLRQQEEGRQKIEMGKLLSAAGQQDIEITNAKLADNAKSWMLKAKAAGMENKYEQAIACFEEAINSESTNLENIFEYAKYLHSIREYDKAEQYYLQCLEKHRLSEKENPKVHLAEIAGILNRLAFLHRVVNEHAMSLKEYDEALEIYRTLAEENPVYLVDVARTLSGLGILHRVTNEQQQALEKYNEALKINRQLAAENQKEYSADLAQTLNHSGVLYWNFKEYAKAQEALEEALAIRKNLAIENPKDYIDVVAQTLNNLAILYADMEQYAKALDAYEEALGIYRKSAAENPKAYSVRVARTLGNLAALHTNTKEYTKSSEEYNEVLEIYKRLAIENKKAYLVYVARTLRNLAFLHAEMEEYEKAAKEYKDALEIYREYAKENPKAYLAEVAETLCDLAKTQQAIKEYTQALQNYKEALQIYQDYAKENPKMYAEILAETAEKLANLQAEMRKVND